jgi:hypothetical protein
MSRDYCEVCGNGIGSADEFSDICNNCDNLIEDNKEEENENKK